MKRFVTIVVVLALGSVAAGAQSAPQLTPQQKQDLSGYNFKGAETALEAQSNQPAKKQDLRTAIPPLKVPPLVTAVTPAESLKSATPAE